MTRTISLIIGIAVTALVVAVPTAFGEGKLAGTQEQDAAAVAPDWFERAAIVAQNKAAVAPDWFERAAIVAQNKAKVAAIVSERTPEPQSMQALRLRSEGLNRQYGLGEFAPNGVDGYVDAGERVVASQSLKALQARSEGLNRKYGLGEFATINGYVDSHERAVPPASTTPTSVSASDSEIQWPQVGIGFGIGLVLLLGLGLTMRAAHVRPFAH